MVKAARPKSGGTNAGAKTSAKAKPKPKPSAAGATKSASTTSSGDIGEQVRITPPVQSPAPQSTSGTWLVVLFFLAVIGTGAFMSKAKWYPRVEPYIAEYLPESLKLDIEDPRVSGLSSRVSELEAQTRNMVAKDKTIGSLEAERAKLSATLGAALKRIESVEQSIGAVRDMVKSTASAEEAAAASKSLKELNARLKKLEAMRQAGATAGSGSVANDIAERVVKLEQSIPNAGSLAERIAKLEKADSQSKIARDSLNTTRQKLASSVAGMETRLNKVESRSAAASAGASSGSATVLMIAQLRDGVHSGQAFPKILAGVKALAGNDPGMKAPLMVLGKHAATGIATLATLRDEFAALASTIVNAANSRGGDGWFDNAMNKVSSLITLRRLDGSGAEGVEALVAQTEARLKAGDLIAAVKAAGELEGLSPPAHDAVASWLTRAKARLAAERALASLHVHAVSLLSPAKE